MTQRTPVDVLISGAGAAGLTLAIDLARRGVSFRLIEKSPHPFEGSRGKGIQPRTQEVFEDLGVLDRIIAAGASYPPVRAYRDDGSHADSPAVETAPSTPGEPHQLALLVPQFATEAVLRERLGELGGAVEFGRELVGFGQDAEGVTAQVAGSGGGVETVRASWLVGADGGRSFVRGALGIGFPGKTLGVRALVADAVVPGLSRDAWHRFNDGSMERQVSLCPLPGTDLFQIQAPVPLEGEVDLSREGLGALVAERTGRDDLAVARVAWASAYNMNARLADRYREGRVVLVGDAAHIHPPTGGQGLNTSVQDAYNLGWKLASVLAGAPSSLLDTYEEERRPIAADVLGLSTKLLDATKQGDHRRGREVRQLDVGYPRSTLALEAPRRACGPLAGDRAPDAPVRRASGQPMRLFDLFAGPHWTLLGHATARGSVPPRPGLRIHVFGEQGDLVDDGGHFANGYALPPNAWVLVRPDGYIGAFVGGNETDTLASYLRGAGLELRT